MAGAVTKRSSALKVDDSVEAQLSDAYRPLHKSFLAIAGAYYAYVTAAHSLDETGYALLTLSGVSAVTALVAFTVLWFVYNRPITRQQVESANGVLHLFMLANVVAYQLLHYMPEKLVYFPLLAVAFAMSATNQRSLLTSVLLTLGAMLGVVWWFDPAAVGSYVFIVIASGVCAIGISTLLRGVITREVAARLRASALASEALAVSAENARLAKMDPLTGLPNRRRFFEVIQEKLAAAGGQPQLVVGLLDLDGFKAVNDLCGHTIGDYVLLEVADRLNRPGNLDVMVARVGGDEFGLLITGQVSDEALLAHAEELRRRLELPFRQPAIVSRLSASTGFARARRGETVASLIERADFAAYEAKNRSRGHGVIFGTRHEERIVRERQLERALLADELEAELYPVLQPIVDVAAGTTVSYELLARWRSPLLGQVSPAEFVPMAERLGQVNRITLAMVGQALALARRLPEGVRISVNLSARDLASADDMNRLVRLLQQSGGADRLDFEVTESAVMRDIGEAVEALLRLRDLGARISLDDFGTGHSSLSRVHRLPLDRIKIDRSFVAAIDADATSQAILRTILDLAAGLKLSCVVEGVETAAQLQALRNLGATQFQGYLFARPLPVEEALGRHGVERLSA